MLQPRITFLITALLLALGTGAQPRQKLNIETATIFLRGAELTSTATVDLAKGENEVLFTNVAGNVNASSIVVNATNSVVVTSAIFQTSYLRTEAPSPRIAVLQDSIARLTAQRKLAAFKIDVLDQQISMLENKSENDKTLPVAELAQMLELIDKKLEGYYLQKNKQDEIVSGIDARIAQLNNNIAEEQAKGVVHGGNILVKLYAEQACTTAVTISYITPDAAWSPLYDIVADNINKPVKFVFKANVYQNSGIQWNNVRLTLSTGNPNESIQAPTLAPWRIAYFIPQPVVYTNPAYTGSKKPLVYSAQEIKTLATTEVADIASLTPSTYQAKRGAGISVGGARKTGTLYIIDGVQVQNIGEGAQPEMSRFVTVDDAGMNTSFDIDLPYTIPADGKAHLVSIRKYELPATYRYYAIPKIDKDVFLQAEVTNWETLDLMPGPANIFFDGTYIGQGNLDTRTVKDTLLISFGRDKKILVKREQDVQKRSMHTIGANIRESFAYTINIRNARKLPIDLVVYDQFPLSNESSIVIENKEAGKGEENETTGIIKWEVSAKPGQSTALKFGYTIKYPKDKTLTGTR